MNLFNWLNSNGYKEIANVVSGIPVVGQVAKVGELLGRVFGSEKEALEELSKNSELRLKLEVSNNELKQARIKAESENLGAFRIAMLEKDRHGTEMFSRILIVGILSFFLTIFILIGLQKFILDIASSFILIGVVGTLGKVLWQACNYQFGYSEYQNFFDNK